MSAAFPTYTPNARKGEAGVALVSKVVSDDLHWFFRRHHQEQDFGIDGQIEIVTEEGHVTGQFIGAQIKYGHSFFKEKNRWGYIYRGEAKHFNYLYNYPAPAIIIICHPKSGDCYWALFDPREVQATDGGWKLTIPFESKLASSGAQLRELVGHADDALNNLQEYWSLNNVLAESERIMYVIDDVDVRDMNAAPAKEFFDRLRSNREIASSKQGTVELSFYGFDNDSRELYEIPEVCQFAQHLASEIPELIFFAAVDDDASGLKALVLCLCRGEFVGERLPIGNQALVEFDTRLLVEFLDQQWPALNEMTDWLGMSEEENKEITYAVLRHLNIDPSEFDGDA